MWELLLFVVQVALCVSSVICTPQVTSSNTNSFINRISGVFDTNKPDNIMYSYSSAGAPTSIRFAGEKERPILELLSNKGLRISIPGPYQPSPFYNLNFNVRVHTDFNDILRGQWQAQLLLTNGQIWTYTFPDIKVCQGDTIYYDVDIVMSSGDRLDYSGHDQVTDEQPHVRRSTLISQFAKISEAPSFTVETEKFTTETPKANKYEAVVERVGDPNLCNLSITTFNNGKRPCEGDIFVDKILLQYVDQIAGNDPDESFTVFSKDNIVSGDDSGDKLFVTLLEKVYGKNFVDKSLTLNSCTSKDSDLCSVQARAYFILPPVIGARETTENTLSFRYGTFYVSAKMPSGSWIVPELWLLPKYRVYGNKSGKIILGMSKGNRVLSDGVTDYSSRVLEAGVEIGSGEPVLFRKVLQRPWSDESHRFTIEWTPDYIQFLVDGEEIGKIEPGEEGLDPSLNGTKLAPFDQEFYISFGVHVGGDKAFPDSLENKPWINCEPKNKLNFWKARKDWYPTWDENSALIISRMSVSALEDYLV